MDALCWRLPWLVFILLMITKPITTTIFGFLPNMGNTGKFLLMSLVRIDGGW